MLAVSSACDDQGHQNGLCVSNILEIDALFGLEWTILNAFDGFIIKSRLQSTQDNIGCDGKLVKVFWWEKKQNGDWNNIYFLLS